jgi:hypothetical protein
MSTPPRKPNVTFSAVQYRADLSGQRIKPINLGVLMEFVAENIWTVGMAMLHTVDAAAVQDLDPISRELIEGRVNVIRSEMSAALKAARRPGDVLRLLAEHNPWAFHIMQPETVVLPVNKLDAVTVEKFAEKYVLEAYARKLHPEPVIVGRRLASLRARQATTAAMVPAEAPPAWMLPTEFLRAPLAARA